MVTRWSALTFLFVILTTAAVSGRLLTKTEDVAEGKLILQKLEMEFSDNDEKQEKPEKNSHQQFFNALTPEEKEWILRLAISHEGEQGKGKSNSMLPKEPPRIPDEIMDRMLNGDISKQFQERLIFWLKRDLGFTDADFMKYEVESSEFCSEGEAGCMSLRNLGGICCPFG